MVDPVDSWASAENARRYADFARTYPTYQQASRDLVALARPAADGTVVDLACGTGSTTEVILTVLGKTGRVIAVDASAAMLAAARSFVRDERVRWVHSPAERLDVRAATGVDAVVCNSAIWQTDVRRTAMAVRRILRPGGRFVFNLGATMLADHPGPAESDVLVDAMTEIAARDHGWLPVSPEGADANRPGLSETGLRQTLHEAGFVVDRVDNRAYQASLAEQRAWLSVPVFTTRLFGRLPYQVRMDVLDKAYRRLALGRPEPVTTHWALFATTAT